MKKILFVFSSLGLGGSQKIEAFVANSCYSQGYQVEVITFSDNSVEVNLNPEIPIHYVPYCRGKNIVSQLKKSLFLINLRNSIKAISPDLLCVFLADITRVVVIATRGLNIPIVASERGAPNRHGKRLKSYNHAFSKCEKVVFQTEEASKYYELDAKHTTVIPNPCFPRWDRKSEISYSPRIICGAGRLCQQKRFDVLIDAFKIVHDKHPDYKLKIYGSGDLQEKLQSQIEKLGLSNSAALCGYEQDVFEKCGRPEIFALSSDYEGVPNILMEAMAIGSACVSTNCDPGGAAMLFNHETRGLLSKKGDANELSQNILKVIEDKQLSAQLREKAKEIVNVFSENIISKQWIDVFRTIFMEK